MLGQHEEVRINNIHIEDFIPWSKGRFWAGQSFKDFPELAMIFKAIDGLAIDSIEEEDKEATAKALEKGYIRKENGKLYPVVTIAPETTINHLMLGKNGDYHSVHGGDGYGTNSALFTAAKKIAEEIADKLWDYAKKELPEHLLYLSGIFASGVIHLEYYLYAEGVKDGILYALPETGCTEGIMASIYYPQLGVQYEEVMKIMRGEIKREELKDGFLSEYKIAELYKNSGFAKKIGLQIGDVMVAVNGVDWKEYWNPERMKSYGNYWNEGDVITVDRSGEQISFTVVF